MKLLWVKDGEWDVLTSSWTAAAKPDGKVELVYVWGPWGGISMFSSATGTDRMTLNLPFIRFLGLLENDREIIDLRHLCEG